MKTLPPRRRPTLEPLEDRLTPSTLPPGFTETLVNTGGALSAPTAMAFAPDGRLFVTQQGGTLELIRNGTPVPALTLTVDSAGERGLLGIAFDPHFTSNHLAYPYYTATTPVSHNRVSRFTVVGDQFTNEQVILDLPALSAFNHNGGAIHFGSDGMLYVAVGENGNPPNSQSLGTMLGKMLRINVAAYDGTPDSASIIPHDNPFFGKAFGLNQLIWALGLRNPFTFAVQPGTGRIFIDDVGQNTWEEIDDGVAGANYGWPNSEGFRKPGDTPTTVGTYHDPLLAYNHSTVPGGFSAIIGGAFYNPPTKQFPASFLGKYFFMDLGGDFIHVFDPSNPGSLSNPDTSTGFATGTDSNPVGLAVDVGGSLYYLARGDGTDTGVVKRIQFTQGPFPQHVIVGADRGGAPTVRVFSTTNILLKQFNPFAQNFAGGVRVAVGDVNGDSVPDIFCAPGPGGGPVVRVFDGATFRLIRQIPVYNSIFTQGVNLAVGDVDPASPGPELVVGLDAGGPPFVNIIDAATGARLRQVQVYTRAYTGGVRVAVGDVDAANGATPEVLTAQEAGGGPFVKILDGASGAFLRQVQVFRSGFTGGVFLATGNINNSGKADILAGPGSGGGPVVNAFEGSTGAFIRNYHDFAGTPITGVRVAAVDVNGDGIDDVLAAVGAGGPPEVQVLDGATGGELARFFVYDPSVTAGLFVVGTG
jgi:glucose/arabinose dehydrogenase